jgi:HPt (histidine-containing phosphotransfer) domain-containing protein
VGEEFLTDLVKAFLDDAPTQLEALRDGVERGDAETARRAAHTLKGNGATFGAASFSELCKGLEERAKSGDLSGAGPLVDEVAAEYARVEAALRARHGGA